MAYSSTLNISSSSESEIELKMSFEVSPIEDSVNEGMHNIQLFRIEQFGGVLVSNGNDGEDENPLGNTNW